MPTYSFQPQFVPAILNKTKRCTIRKIRRYPPRKGQKAYLLTGPRMKPAWIFKKEDCPAIVMVSTIYITESEIYIDFNEVRTQQQASKVISRIVSNDVPEYLERIAGKDSFAWMDGFRGPHANEPLKGCYAAFLNFFKAHHPLPFAGHITYWQWEDEGKDF